MATNLPVLSHEHDAEKVPSPPEEESKTTDNLADTEKIKTDQPSGDTLCSESDSSSRTSCSSGDNYACPSSDENVVAPSPNKALKTVTGSSGKVYKLKRTLDDSGIDVDLPKSLLQKQPRVHLGERIAISGDGKVYSIDDGNRTNTKNKSIKGKMKKKTNKHSGKKLEVTSSYFPCRRIKREASLNAAARVNILYEKEVSPPKPGRKQSTSSTGSVEKVRKTIPKPVAKKPNVNAKKLSAKKFNKDKSKNIKKMKGKQDSGKSKEKVKSSVKRVKEVKAKKGKGTSPKNTKTKSIVSKYKKLSGSKALRNNTGKTVKKPSKSKKVELSQTKKRKLSDKESTKSKVKKAKLDTQRAARTHVSAAPKRGFSGVQCVGCYQQAMCSSTGKLYWKNSDFGDGKTSHENDILTEEKSCHLENPTTPYTSVPSRVQLVDGSPYVNTVVPHQTLPACPRCAQRGSLITTSPCQSYTLGGIGSISSVQVVSYPQHFGGTYPMSYPTSHSALPHCGCGACYNATGIYYPSTTTPMSHQPLSHDTCHVAPPAIPIHITETEESKSDIDIDVGEPEDIKPIISSLTLKESNNEKSRRKSSSSSSKSSSGSHKISEKKVRLQAPKSKRTAEKSTVKQKSKESKSNDKKDVKKKPKYNKSLSRHGWEFDGEPERKKVMSLWLGMSVETNCYQAIRHVDGDVIRVRECVLLCSGPRKTDIPYVAKVTNFWEHPHDGEMMMSLLWYYQPEHTESGRKPHHADCEVFASKHKDENSVACIDDKGYVLTFAEYCRYRAELQRQESGIPTRPKVVPSLEEEYVRSTSLPPQGCDPNTVYLCRQVYDFKLKRILKNPS